MQSIFLITLFTLITSFLAVQGFYQCTNPNEEGTRLTADHLCRKFCSETCTTTGQWGQQGASGSQNFGQDSVCHKRCVNDLASVTTCDQTMLKQALTNACPTAQALSVCLTSCNCCSTYQSSANTCAEMCFRESGGQNNNGQPGYQNQGNQYGGQYGNGYQNQGQGFNGVRPYPINQNQNQPGTIWT